MAAIEVRGAVNAANQIDAFANGLVAATRQGLLNVAYGHRTHMVDRFLSGAPLKRRTGRLASQWTIVEAPSHPDEIRIIEGTDTPYARAQNYGFHGPVFVRQHIRRPARGKKRQRRARAVRKQLLQRSEERAKREDRSRRESASRAAHGMTLRQLAQDRLQARRRRGIQGGIAASVTPDLAREAAATGAYTVRAHGRFMKLRGHRFVERSVAEFQGRAVRIMEESVRRIMGRANG